jgi:poly(A) polymerase Pap1
MTVLTPVFPTVNSTRNVSQGSLKIIQEQLFRASKIIIELRNNQKLWVKIILLL